MWSEVKTDRMIVALKIAGRLTEGLMTVLKTPDGVNASLWPSDKLAL
jgi:hypothetical protein